MRRCSAFFLFILALAGAPVLLATALAGCDDPIDANPVARDAATPDGDAGAADAADARADVGGDGSANDAPGD